MAIVNVGDVVRVACRQTYGPAGPDLINVLHLVCRLQTSVIDDEIRADLGSVIEQIFDPMRIVVANFLKYTTLEMKNITQDILLGITAWPTFVQGGVAGAPTSPQVVALSMMKTDKSRVAGRLNWGGIPETNVTDGVVGAPVLAAMATAQTNMLTDIIAIFSAYGYIVFNREFSTFRVPNGSLAVDVTRTQRRRSLGFGS